MPENSHILQKEEEFLKLNAEIDLKTKDLLTEVNHIKEIQLNNDLLCSKLDDLETLLTNRSSRNDEENKKKKTLNELDNSKAPSEEDYTLTDYLSKLRDITESATSVDDKYNECIKTKGFESFYGRKNGRNVKLSQSAKVLKSVSTTVVGNDSSLPLGLTRHKSDIKCDQSEIIPETLKGVSQDGITRFLTAKVKILTEQLKKMQNEERKYLEKIKNLQSNNDKFVEEKDRLFQQANTTKTLLVKCEQHAKNVSFQLQATQNENGLLKKEVEALKKELNEYKKNSSANEIRLNRTLEELSKLKSALKQIKQEEKESKENHRKKIEELSSIVKKLDKQRSELLNGFKKQLLIIDNLKRQKELIEIGKLLRCAEEDFINFLDYSPPNSNKNCTYKKSVRVH